VRGAPIALSRAHWYTRRRCTVVEHFAPRRDERTDSARRVLTTPLGSLTIVAGPAGVREVSWNIDSVSAKDGPGRDVARAAAVQLEEYFAGVRRTFELPLDIRGTPFQRTAWFALTAIPYGSTVSYGRQARRLGLTNGARAVGSANARNPLTIVLPCHRLVGATGAPIGYAGGIAAKQALLEHERRVVAATSSF
jgi:methylated-DNA-[protein]-cysteine S-methyltransferase